MILAFAIAAVPSFVASIVEWVEAFTIVLAVGDTRGWRSPIWGTAAGLGTLALTIGRQIGESSCTRGWTDPDLAKENRTTGARGDSGCES